jgi:hypothetical protein
VASIAVTPSGKSAASVLWSARNAEEHGIAEVATLQKSAIAIGAFGGYCEEEGELGPNGERTFRYVPLPPEAPPFFAMLSEHIKLRPIVERERTLSAPSGYDYDLGMISAPVALAKVGLDFLLQEVAGVVSFRRVGAPFGGGTDGED